MTDADMLTRLQGFRACPLVERVRVGNKTMEWRRDSITGNSCLLLDEFRGAKSGDRHVVFGRYSTDDQALGALRLWNCAAQIQLAGKLGRDSKWWGSDWSPPHDLLRPCPFCGSDRLKWDARGAPERRWIGIQCECGVWVSQLEPELDIKATLQDRTAYVVYAVLERWNRRDVS